jgi:type II secretion system protein I
MIARRRGFSLLEVLVAMAIFTVGATSILALFAAAAATHKRSIDRTRAAMVAEGVVAEVQARYFPGQDLGDLESAVRRELPEKIDGYTWTVFLERPADGESGKGKKTARSKSPPPRLLIGVKDRKPLTSTSSPGEGKSKTAAKGPPIKGSKDDHPTGGSSDPPAWGEEEVLLRVTITWSQSGRPVTESYDTLILPRRAPPEQKSSTKAPRKS